MKTKVVTFSERTIKAEQAGSARTLRDPAFPLRFRFHQSRETGSWYVVKRDKWTKLGDWPCVTWRSIHQSLPEILIRVETSADVSLAVDGFTHCGQVFDWFIEQQANKVGNKCLSSLKSAFVKHINPVFGELHISLLNESEIKKFIKSKGDYSKNTIRQWVGYINQAMSDGFISGVFEIGLSRPSRFNLSYFNEQESSSFAYVYAMTNPALIGLYKVGMTVLSIEKRRQSLSACTSIPFDFEVYRYISVNKSQVRKVERIAHDLLSSNRVSNNKEFFKADSKSIIDDVFDDLEKRFGIKC